MAKITKSDRTQRDTVVVKTKAPADKTPGFFHWWKSDDDKLAMELVSTAAFLKEQQQYRFRQASIHARMYGNIPLTNAAGQSYKFNQGSTLNLPVDRPTMNVVQSCVDTLVSRISQSKPKPMFLTDGGDYKARTLSKQMNQFIQGEFYQTKAYELGSRILRDASTLGDGCIKILENNKKVSLERTLLTELFVDQNDAFYGAPRSMYQFKLVDRSVAKELFPKEKREVNAAQQAYPEEQGDSQKTASDQIMLVEAWHLPSGPDAKDGRHSIVCTSGVLFDEPWNKDSFPFVFLPYSPRLVGFWSQGLAEQLAGTQMEINKLLVTISQSINLVGVPRVFVEDGSKVVKAHLNNNIGSIVTYRGTKPQYEVAPCVPAELYGQLQRLVEYAYQQSGISSLAATSQKPAGLDSGQAIREYDNLQSDRFATLNQRYDNMYIELAYQIIDKACDIAERDGSYDTVYPNKDGTKEINLPDIKKLKADPFIIQCYDSNSLPKDPAGRKQAIVEDMQAGILSLQEGRRLLNYSDLEQDDKLANAAEERILKYLDAIVEDGSYTPPDPFIDIETAKTKVTQYYNLYVAYGLEESRAQMLRDWQAQVLMLEQAAQPPAQVPMGPDGAPLATPTAPPQSQMLPNAPMQ